MNFLANLFKTERKLRDSCQTVIVPLDLIQFKLKQAVAYVRFYRGILSFRTRRIGAILNGDWDLSRVSVCCRQPMIGFEERFLENRKWENTSLYAGFHARLKYNGTGRGGVKTWDEYKIKHLSRWDRIYVNMREGGYKSQEVLGGRLEDEVEVAVSRHGEILIVDGQHRLAIAKLLNIRAIPVIIDAVHSNYLGASQIEKGISPTELIDRIIEHKDLRIG